MTSSLETPGHSAASEIGVAAGDAATNSPTPRTPSRSLGALLALLLPVLVHVALVLRTLIGSSEPVMNSADVAVSLLVGLYAGAGYVSWRIGRGTVPLAILGYATIVSLVAVEVALRHVDPLPPFEVPTRPMYIRTRAVAEDVMPGVSGPGKLAFREYSIDSLGLRGGEVELDRMDFRILCVGGSTTENFYVTDRKTWPWRLQDILEERWGKRVFVGNAGKQGQLTAHHAYLVRRFQPASRFDHVILMTGGNDAHRHLLHDHAERVAAVPDETLVRNKLLADWEEIPYYRATHLAFTLGNICRRIRLARLRGTADEREVLLTDQADHHAKFRAERARKLRERPLTEPPADLDIALERFRHDFTDLIHACRERKLPILVLTQPCIYFADMPPELHALTGLSTREGAYEPGVLERIVDDFNRVALDVCAAENVEAIDLANLVSKDTTTFCDDFHFNISGNEKAARIVAEYFMTREAHPAK